MRLSSVLIGATLLVFAPAALCAEPCAPLTKQPYHVSAFASASPDGSEPAPAVTLAPHVQASELALQTHCLAWESSLSPKAELLGVVPFGPQVPSGAYRPQVAAPQETVRIASSTGGSALRSSTPGTNLFEATPGTGTFSLGARLISVP